MSDKDAIRVKHEQLKILLDAIQTHELAAVEGVLREYPDAARWQTDVRNGGLVEAVSATYWIESTARDKGRRMDEQAIVDLLVDNGGDLPSAVQWINERFDNKQKAALAQSLAGRPARLAEKFRAAVEKTTDAMGEGLARPIKRMHLFLRPFGPSTL